MPNSTDNSKESAIVVEDNDEPYASKEKPVDFTWVLDSAESGLGGTGKYETLSEIRQETCGIQAAIKIGKLMGKCDGEMEADITFPTRVHILAVMREILMAALETEGTRVAT